MPQAGIHYSPEDMEEDKKAFHNALNVEDIWEKAIKRMNEMPAEELKKLLIETTEAHKNLGVEGDFISELQVALIRSKLSM